MKDDVNGWERRRSIFRKRGARTERETEKRTTQGSERDTSQLTTVPIIINFTPFSVGKEFESFLEKKLGVKRISLKLDEDCIDPLLIESRVIPNKLLAGAGSHSNNCPFATGNSLTVSAANPSDLCQPCGVDCEIGAPMIRLPVFIDSKKCGTVTFVLQSETTDFNNIDLIATIRWRFDCAFEIAILREHNRLLEITDSLTRVHNYRYFIKTLDNELERSRRYDHPFSILIIDIAKLSSFNERYGFELGDILLKEIAQLLKKCVRNTDTVARYSGGKFAVVLTETNSEGAVTAGEKIKSTIGQFSLPHPDQNHELKALVNIGVSTFPHDAVLSSRLILSAENNLRSKKSGII